MRRAASSVAQNTMVRAILPGSLRYIRSDVPVYVSPEEKETLLAENIRTVVDLRTAEECAAKLCPLETDERFCYLHLPVTGGNAIPQSRAMVPVSYLKMVDEQMEHILDAICHAGSNVLYFCNAGKDRTGVTAMLLLLLAGVPEETVVADYVPSENNMKELFALQRRQLAQAGQPVPPMSVFSSAPEEIRMALDYLQQHYAGAEDYLLQAGVSPAEIDAVRGMLLGRGE